MSRVAGLFAAVIVVWFAAFLATDARADRDSKKSVKSRQDSSEPGKAPPERPPQDKPASITREQIAAFERAIAPHVAKARASYPQAKRRFLAGLPRGEKFFVTTRLHDKNGKWEQVFIAVRRIQGEQITGTIDSNLAVVKEFTRGQQYTFAEANLLDWVVAKPDGKEEGNFVGKFLDTYKP